MENEHKTDIEKLVYDKLGFEMTPMEVEYETEKCFYHAKVAPWSLSGQDCLFFDDEELKTHNVECVCGKILNVNTGTAFVHLENDHNRQASERK